MRQLFALVVFPALLICAQRQTSTTSITLQSTRKVLSERMLSGSPDALGEISLKAFDFSREFEIGKGLHVIAISCQWNGGLPAFHADGSLIQMTQIGPISSIQLVDLDEDGVSEIITEEKEGRGTGVLLRSFNLHTVSNKSIANVWKAPSYSAASSEYGKAAELHEGFLRFDPAAFGETAKLTYLWTKENGTVLKRETYGLKAHHLVLLTDSSSKGRE
ncbi:MAG: hypothetical protein ACRD5M_11505 [Candidatus Acidiferrales bacterium]